MLPSQSIASENIQVHRKVLKQDNKEHAAFLLSVSEGLSQLDFSALNSVASLDMLSEAISRLFADCWATYAKRITVTSCSKKWWNNKCRTALETYRRTGERSDWSLFCSTTRQAKRQFFNNRIAKIASTNKQPWNLKCLFITSPLAQTFQGESVSVIIPKPGKPAYNIPKAFRPIVLLNTLGKLIEKMVARRLQFDAIKYGILHPNQLGGVAQRSTEDTGVFLTHLV